MGKKKRRITGTPEKKEERGYRVVDLQGKPVYAPVEGGVSQKEAERMSDDLILATKVIRIEEGQP